MRRMALASSSGGDRRSEDRGVDALHFLYVRYADDVCGYVSSIVHNRHDAEDVTH